MKEKIKELSIKIGIVCMVSLVCTAIFYRFFPQYLCYQVMAVNESKLYDAELYEMEQGASYTEYFKPQRNYLKSIALNLAPRKIKKGDTIYEIKALLKNKNGKIIEESVFLLENLYASTYCEFKIEKWVKSGEEYLLEIQFPDCEGVYVTFGPSDIGPAEHVQLTEGDTVIDENMYMRYIYGTYSKKLLAFWFVVFFISTYMLGESIAMLVKKQKK